MKKLTNGGCITTLTNAKYNAFVSTCKEFNIDISKIKVTEVELTVYVWSENDEKARKTAPIEELLEFIKNYHSDVISLDYQDERLAEGLYPDIRDFLKANN